VSIVYLSPGLASGANDGTTAANAFRSWGDFATAGCAAGSDVRVNADENSTSTCALTANINGTIILPTTITGYSTDWATPTLRFRNGTGAGANVDGFSFNAVQYVTCSYLESKNYTRDGFNDLAACTGLMFKKCSAHNNTGGGFEFSGFAHVGGMTWIDCVAYSNGTIGIYGRSTSGVAIRRCLSYSNGTNGFQILTSSVGMILDCISHSNGVGVATSTTGGSLIKNCVIDRNTTGINFVAASIRGTQAVQCRITNNTTGIAVATGVALQTFMCAFYGNTAKSALAGTGVLEESDNVDMAADGYVNGAAGNYNLINGATPAEARWTAAGVGDATNKIYWTAGLSPLPDMPTAANTRPPDTTDGVLGTQTAQATDADYLALEATRNNDNGTVAADLATTKSVKVRDVTINGTHDEAARNTITAAKVESGHEYQHLGALETGTLPSGALPVPTAPTLAGEVMGSSTVELSWNAGLLASTFQPKYKLAASAEWSNFGSSTIVSKIKVTGLTAASAYNFKVTATNDSGSTDSNVVNLTTGAAQDILTAAEARMVTLIEAMTTAGGYNFNWGNCNEKDQAKKDTFPNAEIYLPNEDGQDDPAEGVNANSYTNKTQVEIHVYGKNTTLTDNPEFSINAEYNKAVDDLKRVFNTDPSLNGKVFTIEYLNWRREPKTLGEIITPSKLIARFVITYAQDRATPSLPSN
jgi:hypothetical protein